MRKQTNMASFSRQELCCFDISYVWTW